MNIPKVSQRAPVSLSVYWAEMETGMPWANVEQTIMSGSEIN